MLLFNFFWALCCDFFPFHFVSRILSIFPHKFNSHSKMYFCYDIRFVCCTIFIICWIEFSRLRAIRICQLRTVMCGGSISHRRTSSPIWLADRQCDNNAAVVVTYWVLEYYTGHKCGSNAWQQMHELSVQSTICNIFSHFFFVFLSIISNAI